MTNSTNNCQKIKTTYRKHNQLANDIALNPINYLNLHYANHQ